MRPILLAVAWIAAVAVVPAFVMDASAAGKCPGKSSVKRLASEGNFFKDASPINMAGLNNAKALRKGGNKKLAIYIGNITFSPKVLDAGMINPVAKKGEAIVELKLMNDGGKFEAGEYKASNPYGKAFSAEAGVHVKGMNTTMAAGGSSRSKGSVTITEITDKNVCGTFDITGELGSAAGEFSAAIEE